MSVCLPPFYLNLVVTNAKEVVAAKIDTKLGKGPFGFGVLNKAAKSLASRIVKDEKVTAGLAAQLVERIPVVIAEMGIAVTVRQRWLQGSYCALPISVTELDAAVQLTKVKGQEFSDHFKALCDALDFLGVDAARATVDDKVNSKVQEALMSRLVEVLPCKLHEQGGLEVVVSATTERDQAEFFFSFMEELRQVPQQGS
jgi:hypothetical protein